MTEPYESVAEFSNNGFVDVDNETADTVDERDQLPFSYKAKRSESAVSFNKLDERIEIVDSEESVSRKFGIDYFNLLLAGTLVQDAMYGRNIPHAATPEAIRTYNVYNHWACRLALYVSIAVVLGLAVFEKPAMPNLAAEYWVTMIIEGMCLFVFIGRFIHNVSFIPGRIFWKDKKNIVLILIITLTWIDMVTYIVIRNMDESKAIRWSRPLRPLFIINFTDGRQIRRAFRNIRRTLVDIMNVLILFAFCIMIFSLLAFKLFHKRDLKYPNGKPYFSSYLDCIWDLYVLVTTANNPDVMMPAYDRSNWFVIFFLLYVMISNYIFMSILLAVIYNNYRKHLKNEVKSYVFHKRQLLGHAFDIMKEKVNGRHVVTKDRWHLLMKIISPERSSVQVDLLLYVLDETGAGFIERSQFLNVADLLNVQVNEVKDKINIFEKYLAGCYLSKPSEFLKTCIRHKFFRYFFDLCIIVNAVCIGLTIDDAEWYFLALFTIEILLKIYAKGVKKFCKSYWNLFDTIIILSALIATAIESLQHEYLIEESTLDILLVLRVLRLIKLIGSIKRFKIIITTIMNIGPSIATYGGVIFIFYYIYAIVGMELFAGRIHYSGYGNASTPYCGNEALKGSDFYASRYCSNNFNNIVSAFVILFELMYVNQWHILTQGFVLVTSEWAKLYFFSFHIFCVLLVLNIFVAFVLEVFILEYNIGAGSIESAIETKIAEMGLNVTKKKKTNDNNESAKMDKSGSSDNMQTIEKNHLEMNKFNDEKRKLPEFMTSSDLRFHLKKKTRKPVLTLLQAMFENELNPEDIGPENLDDSFESETDNSIGNSKFYTP